ncbi:aryl-alcohol dehydrogenase-like predicted oxidoreductase [Bradyrhizobium sp. JR4.1]
MKRSRLGSLDVTSLGLGSAPLGGLFTPVSDADAEATIARAWSLGIRFFDTAPLYGFGLAERRLGAFLRQQPRDSFAISTKVDRLLDELCRKHGTQMSWELRGRKLVDARAPLPGGA